MTKDLPRGRHVAVLGMGLLEAFWADKWQSVLDGRHRPDRASSSLVGNALGFRVPCR